MTDLLPFVDVGVTGLLALVFLMVLTDRLVWYKRLAQMVAERDRWQEFALRSIGVTESLIEPAEASAEVLTRLPIHPEDS